MVDQINMTRAALGLPGLKVNLQMVRLGREWSRHMARENRVYHRSNLAAVVDGNFDRITDNVGFTALDGATDAALVERLHRAFMGSSGHRAQILGRFNQVGVGIHRQTGGRMWITVNFLNGPLDGFPLYRDVAQSDSQRAIERLFIRGAVRGCTRNLFCTGSTATRAYLAAVIDRATGTRSASYYVASTCASSWYCRNTEVTRRELAIMVAAAIDLDRVSGSRFTDIRTTDRGTINAIVGGWDHGGVRDGPLLPRPLRHPRRSRRGGEPRHQLTARTLAAAATLVAVVAGGAACTSAPEPAPAPAPSKPESPPVVSATPSPSPSPAATARSAIACAGDCRRAPRVVGRFRTASAPEASGLAASRRNGGVLYVLDDGPGTTSVLAIRARNARIVSRLTVEGLTGTDTEGLAVGPCDPRGSRSCIYIGDIGDNTASRDAVTITKVEEPALTGRAITIASEQVSLRYPDGPADAEALLVGNDATVLLVTKDPGSDKRGRARLYSAPFADAMLRKGPRVRLPEPSLPLAAAVLGNVVTGADAAPGRVVVRTYDAVYEFTAPRPDAPLKRFPSWPVAQLQAPGEAQGEAIAYAADGCGLYTVGEGSGAVTSIPCR